MKKRGEIEMNKMWFVKNLDFFYQLYIFQNEYMNCKKYFRDFFYDYHPILSRDVNSLMKCFGQAFIFLMFFAVVKLVLCKERKDGLYHLSQNRSKHCRGFARNFANISWFCHQISKILFSYKRSSDKDANRR